VALGVTLVFFIVFFNVYQGVKEVSPVVLANARMLGASQRQLLRHVYLPSATSWVFSSLHTSVGLAFVGAVVGEYLGSSQGVGYLILQAEGPTRWWCPRATPPAVIAPWGEPVGIAGNMPAFKDPTPATAPPTRPCRWACTTTACTTTRSTARPAAAAAGHEPRVHRRRPAAPGGPPTGAPRRCARRRPRTACR
jgi:hypothetical protein